MHGQKNIKKVTKTLSKTPAKFITFTEVWTDKQI